MENDKYIFEKQEDLSLENTDPYWKYSIMTYYLLFNYYEEYSFLFNDLIDGTYLSILSYRISSIYNFIKHD
jgi:hypothetical protein